LNNLEAPLQETYYRTGQAAKKLGVSSYHVRRLCEAGEIAAEITNGQQWKISAPEVNRLLEEGIPPVPRAIEEHPEPPLVTQPTPTPEGLYAEPSDRVIQAAEEVRIVESHLHKRRLEREVEEVEDWFRDRQRRDAAGQEEERRQQERRGAESHRQNWIHSWTQQALNALPSDAPGQLQLEVNAAVRAALAAGHPSEPEAITLRLVAAALEKALRPWVRTKQARRAVDRALDGMPYEIRYGSEFAGMKQRASEAATTATSRLHPEASQQELDAAASEAVRPLIAEFNHLEACKRTLAMVYVFDLTPDEQDDAKDAVATALAALAVGATAKQLERAKEAALAPFEAKAARRSELRRAEAEQQQRHIAAERNASVHLGHIECYLDREYEFDGGYLEMREEAARLRPGICKALCEQLFDAEMSRDQIYEFIEGVIDEEM
jgi:excisionase family DNA binding protein